LKEKRRKQKSEICWKKEEERSVVCFVFFPQANKENENEKENKRR